MAQWIEDARPQSLSGLLLAPHVRVALNGATPDRHYLFSGAPGCGKTSAAHALARKWRASGDVRAVLEINASDNRGVETMRKLVREYALGGDVGHVRGALRKVLILDEADQLTAGAQAYLKRVLDATTETERTFGCVVIVICNYRSRLEPFLTSALTHILMPGDVSSSMPGYLVDFALKQGRTINLDYAREVATIYGPDIRGAVVHAQHTPRPFYLDLRSLLAEPSSANIRSLARSRSMDEMDFRATLLLLLSNCSSSLRRSLASQEPGGDDPKGSSIARPPPELHADRHGI